MVGSHHIVLAGMAAVAALICGWLLLDLPDGSGIGTSLEAVRAPTGIPEAAEMRALEATAAAACRCQRRLEAADGVGDGCWSDFYRHVTRYAFHPPEGANDLCVSLEDERLCFGEGDGLCIFKRHRGGGCSAEEGRILAAIWEEWFARSPEEAERRMDAAEAAFMRGERMAASGAPAPSGGCSG